MKKLIKVLMRSGEIGWLYLVWETDTQTRYYLIIDQVVERYRIPKGKQRPFDIIEIDEA